MNRKIKDKDVNILILVSWAWKFYVCLPSLKIMIEV